MSHAMCHWLFDWEIVLMLFYMYFYLTQYVWNCSFYSWSMGLIPVSHPIIMILYFIKIACLVLPFFYCITADVLTHVLLNSIHVTSLTGLFMSGKRASCVCNSKLEVTIVLWMSYVEMLISIRFCRFNAANQTFQTPFKILAFDSLSCAEA